MEKVQCLHFILAGWAWELSLFTLDRLSNQFGSFGSAEIAAIGQELHVELTDLLDHPGLQAPLGLKRCQSPPVG
ncbi:hypothetical protein AQJ27_46530 [Streptomyces olivochromogenes]|uniref:Uncharacterized protein n=1 Tax=Streptomyces olivochromogenes TaxID=1963 RepID=A0A250VU19_STROL|nr:hypothetical protein AQJ27_46530 [Streptomyces olivochromogenes]GAX57586.1 hypothetical protein SO3561_09156 [Streptomyces olivochromogenes]